VGRKIVKDSLTILLVFIFTIVSSLLSLAEEAAVKSQKVDKGAKVQPKLEKKATLNLKAGSGQSLEVELINIVPVRGMQFIVSGVNITEVRTTKRTAGFLAKFNEKNGAVILLSTSGDKIASGKGSVAEIICDKPGAATLSGVKIVGPNRESL